jgi:hypothetical protein
MLHGDQASYAKHRDIAGFRVPSAHKTLETRLAGWAYRIRNGESVRELSNWNSLTTSPEVCASPAAETLRVRAA